MARGRAFAQYLEEGPLHNVYSGTTPSWDFLYEHTTTISPDYNIGDRVVLPDGRVFRYAYADTARTTGLAMSFYAKVAQGYTNLAADQAIGDKSVKVVSSIDLALDELRGGYIQLYTGDPLDNTFRGILGNTAVSATETTTIYLDAALHIAVTTSTGSEFFYNPYAHVAAISEDYTSVAGVAVADMATAGYCWIQTWGMIRLSFKTGINAGKTADQRQLVFAPDGALFEHGNVGSTSGDKGLHQHAGFIVDKTSASTGSYALIMLQISP